MERVPVGRRAGAGQTKALLRGPEYGGLPARKGLLFPQRKMHDFVPEEMSHLHSGAGGVWKHRVEYKEDKMQEKIKVYLKTRVNCNILRTMNFSKYGLPHLSLYGKEIVSL